MLHTKYQTSAPFSFRKEEFWSFPSLFLCFELVTPGARPVLTPGASYEHSWYKSTRRYFIPNIKALHFLVSEKKNFKVFLLCSYVSNLWPPPGAGPVLTPGASYEQSWYRSTRRYYIQNIKALHFLVSEKKNFKVFFLCSYVSNLWPPGWGQFWAQGHHINNLGRGPLGDATY